MANEIQLKTTSGQTLYAVGLNPQRLYFNTSTATFEAENDGNWGQYKIALTEPVAGSGLYFGSVPTNLPAGLTLLPIYIQASVPAAPTDARLTTTGCPEGLTFVLDWSGTAANSIAPTSGQQPQVQLPQSASSLRVASQILTSLYTARQTIALTGLASITIDGQQTVFNDPAKLDESILFWERKVALLSGRRRRTRAIWFGHRR